MNNYFSLPNFFPENIQSQSLENILEFFSSSELFYNNRIGWSHFQPIVDNENKKVCFSRKVNLLCLNFISMLSPRYLHNHSYVNTILNGCIKLDEVSVFNNKLICILRRRMNVFLLIEILK